MLKAERTFCKVKEEIRVLLALDLLKKLPFRISVKTELRQSDSNTKEIADEITWTWSERKQNLNSKRRSLVISA